MLCKDGEYNTNYVTVWQTKKRMSDLETGALEAKSDNVPPLFRRYVFVGKEVKL